MKHAHKIETKSRWGRLKLVGAGVVLADVGAVRMFASVQVVRHANGQPMFPWGLVAAGLLCFVLGLIPTSWLAKAAAIPRAGWHR